MDSRIHWCGRPKEVLRYVPRDTTSSSGEPGHGSLSWVVDTNDPHVRCLDMVLMEQAPKFGNPPVLLSDMRPKEPPLLFVMDHAVAEQMTKPTKQFSTSVPKTPNMKNLSPLVGERSLVNLDVGCPTESHPVSRCST